MQSPAVAAGSSFSTYAAMVNHDVQSWEMLFITSLRVAPSKAVTSVVISVVISECATGALAKERAPPHCFR